ncbi:MAG: hypothetical protein PHI66_04050 [Candidatus Pacebacteria bacterium]|nr:hypothetical protein [Candidatus Paceibacterota bacterium]
MEPYGWEIIQSTLRDRFNLSVGNIYWTEGANIMLANLPDGKMLILGLSEYTNTKKSFVIVGIMIYEVSQEEYERIKEQLPKDVIVGIALKQDCLCLCLKFFDFLGFKERIGK